VGGGRAEGEEGGRGGGPLLSLPEMNHLSPAQRFPLHGAPGRVLGLYKHHQREASKGFHILSRGLGTGTGGWWPGAECWGPGAEGWGADGQMRDGRIASHPIGCQDDGTTRVISIWHSGPGLPIVRGHFGPFGAVWAFLGRRSPAPSRSEASIGKCPICWHGAGEVGEFSARPRRHGRPGRLLSIWPHHRDTTHHRDNPTGGCFFTPLLAASKRTSLKCQNAASTKSHENFSQDLFSKASLIYDFQFK
jgi:hypothetical protein